jgi:hypothetical protein
VGEEKVIDDFAYSFAWGLYIMCRDPLQKDRGRGDVFFEGCVCGVWKWKEGGGMWCWWWWGHTFIYIYIHMYHTPCFSSAKTRSLSLRQDSTLRVRSVCTWDLK